MKKQYLLLILFSLMISGVYAQSDNCASATVITVTPNCTAPVNGTTIGATADISGCVGNADDDVWYQFTATAVSHQITVTPSANMDAVVQMLSGACGNLTTLYCQDNGISGQPETVYASGLTIGSVYTVRVYNFGAGAGSGTFTICITNPPPPPANNTCAGAVSLPITTSCTYTAGTTVGATQSYPGCVGTADDDVWYSFTATNSTATITVDPSSSMDAVIQMYSGSCALLNSIQCMDNGLANGNEVLSPIGLVAGNTYYVRVYDYYSANGGYPFNICITGPPSSSIPTNDNPCNAIALPAVTSDCNYSQFTTTGATASMTAPTPSACTGGSAPQQGGFSSASHDVWFSVVAPANGKLTITPQPGYGINDAAMVLYSGTCSSLTQITCSDDHNFPGTSNDLKPYISQSGLTPGATYFIRYFAYGSGSGNFGICVSSPDNDLCSTALYICNLNGYNASTSAAYTPDRPCNMFGDNENSAGVDQPDGTNTGGVFGQGGSWGNGSQFYDVDINNNSWIRFTASAVTAVLNVTIGNCWVGNYPSGGIQMQIFSGANCCGFTPVSNFEENSTGFTITGNGLTIGNDYYLMVDGYAGDICNYTITANTGVQFPGITAIPSSVCIGGSSVLTAPAGATSYQWLPGGQTTQSITDSPSTTSTYTCIASGICGFKQTITKTITVNPQPVITVSSDTICSGHSAVLNAAGGITYSWSNGGSGPSISVNPTSTASYTVTGTDIHSCTNTAIAAVTISQPPTLLSAPVSAPSNCGQSTGSLTGVTVGGSGTLQYSWTNAANVVVGNTANLNNQPAGTYNLTVTNSIGCSSVFGPYSIINPSAPIAPVITASATTVCVGASITLTASSTALNPSYTWTGPNSTSNQAVLTIPVTTIADSGPYAVSVTSSGCTGPAAIISITVNPLPLVNATSASAVVCSGNTVYLISSGGAIYSWTGPNSFSSGSQTVPLYNATTAMSGIYTVTVTDVNGCTGSDTTAILIKQTPDPVVAANVSTCNGAPLTFTALSTGTINWYSDALLTNLVQANSSHYSPAVSSGTTVTYYAVALYNGCTSSVTAVTGSNFNVNANASASDTTGFSPITVNFTNLSTGVNPNDNFLWVFGDGDTSTSYNAVNTFAQGGNYPVMLVVTETTSGCVDTAFINVSYSGETLILIPNIFTPNNDNDNDIFTIKSNRLKTLHCIIFDRWGLKMYEWDGLHGSWDGKAPNGSAASEGTYFYIIKASDFDSKQYDKQGAFQLTK